MTLSMAVLICAGIVGCRGGGSGSRDPILGGAGSAALAPVVTRVSPADSSTGVALTGTVVTATFNEAMASFAGGATFAVTAAAPAPEPMGTVTLDATGTLAAFTPSAPLAPLTLYTATISGAAALSTGLAMAAPYTWRFTTGPQPVPPAVTLTYPATTVPGPTLGAPTNTAVTAAFTKEINPASLTAASFTLTGPTAGTIAGMVSYASRTAVFVPSAPLTAATTYTATLTTAVTDLGGDALAGNLGVYPAASAYVWTFTTGLTPDSTVPGVTLTVPATTVPPATGVATNTAIAVTFTKAMNPATLNAATFTLTGTGGAALGGTVTYTSGTATFTPTLALATATTYTATITRAAKDLAGNPLAANYVWTFSTGAAPDYTKPMVTLTVPATSQPGPTGVALNAAVTASFTKAMNPASLTTASFTLASAAGAQVIGSVSYASGTAVFTPSTPLAPTTTYTATISTAATDLAGNQLAGNQAPLPASSSYVWSFTTGSAPVVTLPQVSLTIPATTTPGPTLLVPVNSAIEAVFTKPMNPTSLNAASFTLTVLAPGVSPLGSVTYAAASQTALFTPLAPLTAGTTYTATITTGATDLAGNRLGGNQAPLPAPSAYVWTFTTSAALLAPPTILLTSPAALATNQALNVAVNATFSEAINPSTLHVANFTVQTSGLPLGPALSGAVTYDPVADVATFTPAANLLPNTSYTATVTGATDLAGDPLASGLVPNPWTFTTGSAALAPGAINLGSVGTFGIMATSAITSTGLTIINGDVSLDPGTSLTGFPPGVVNGTIHLNDTVAAQARIDLLTAFNSAKTLPPGTTITAGADLGALYPLGIPPGTYTSGSTMLVSSPLTLDAGGNANAVWVFQIGSSLTTGASVSLANGAQAKNVFWVPTLDATVGVGTVFYGNIISGRSVTGVTGSTINGRILAGATTAGTIALQTTTVNVPAP